MQLNSFASVKTGLVLSRKRADSKKNAVIHYKQINLRAIDSDGQVNFDELENYYADEKLSNDYITQQNDIIVKLIEPFTAVYINKQLEGLLVPSHYCIIKDVNKKFIPKFIYFCLNSQAVVKEFFNSLQGTVIKNIRPSTLQELKIAEISIKEQQNIVKFLDLQQQKLLLLKKLQQQEKLKQIYITNKLLNYKEKKN